MAELQAISVWDQLVGVIDAGSSPPTGPAGEQILASPRSYRGSAPVTAPLGYFLLGIAPSTPFGFYNGQDGEEGLYQIHCWATKPTHAIKLASWLKGLIHHQTFTLTGQTMLFGRVTGVSGPIADVDGKAWQSEVTYEVTSL